MFLKTKRDNGNNKFKDRNNINVNDTRIYDNDYDEEGIDEAGKLDKLFEGMRAEFRETNDYYKPYIYEDLEDTYESTTFSEMSKVDDMILVNIVDDMSEDNINNMMYKNEPYIYEDKEDTLESITFSGMTKVVDATIMNSKDDINNNNINIKMIHENITNATNKASYDEIIGELTDFLSELDTTCVKENNNNKIININNMNETGNILNMMYIVNKISDLYMENKIVAKHINSNKMINTNKGINGLYNNDYNIKIYSNNNNCHIKVNPNAHKKNMKNKINFIKKIQCSNINDNINYNNKTFNIREQFNYDICKVNDISYLNISQFDKYLDEHNSRVKNELVFDLFKKPVRKIFDPGGYLKD